MSADGETVSYTYDGKLLTSVAYSGTLNQTLDYTYNDDFDLISFDYAGQTQNYTYDLDGLLTSAGNYTITRNTQNGLPEAVSGSGLNISRTFNGYGELASQSVTVGSQSAVQWTLTRDDAGRIISKTETADGATHTYDYTYDAVGRLLTVTRNGTLIESYSYDLTGTRTSETNTLRGIADRGFSYSDEDHLLTAGDTVYSYDLDGFLAAKTESGQVTTYDYTTRGELLEVQLPDGRVISYEHDPRGRRIAKRIDAAIVEKYLWQGRTRLLAVYDGSDSLIQSFEYADSRMPVSMTMSGVTYFLAYDQVGSLRIVADGSGNVVKRVDYDSFGNIISDTYSSLTVPFGFAGGLHDRDTGLVRFGYRDYDPDTGRWTAKDPIGFAGGDTDLYGYVFNNPVNLIDPDGLFVGVASGMGAAAYSFLKALAFTANATLAAEMIGNLMDDLEDDLTPDQINDVLAGGSGADTDAPCENDNRQTPDQEALKDIIQEETLGGRKPLSDEDADTVLDWADELGIDGARDDRGKDHWEGGEHIHVPGSGLGHIPTGSR